MAESLGMKDSDYSYLEKDGYTGWNITVSVCKSYLHLKNYTILPCFPIERCFTYQMKIVISSQSPLLC